MADEAGVPKFHLSPARDLDSAAKLSQFAWDESRRALPPNAFASGSALKAPLVLEDFLPAGRAIGKGEAIQGTMTLYEGALSIHVIGTLGERELILPEKTLGIITHGDRIVPVPAPETIVIDQRRRFTLLFGVGRVWREAGDQGQSRALMPISIVDSRYGAVRNGVASFLYGDGKPVSHMIMQFSQETAAGREADLWGTLSLDFVSGQIEGAQSRIAAYEDRMASAPLYQDWVDLAGRFSADAIEGFDGPLGKKGSVSTSGLIIDDTVYLKGCNTRHGLYPFCRQMRHGITSMTPTFLGFMAVAHFAHRVDEDVLNLTIGELVPELADHPQWRRTRILDMINMASGLGEIVPERTASFVTADSDPTAREIEAAQTIGQKLSVAKRFPAYPWAPGTVFRFRLSDSFVLALALDRLVKQHDGQGATLRWILQDRFFKAIGIARLQMQMSVGASPDQRVPDLGNGLYPTTGELVRLILVLRHSTGGNIPTGLSRDLVVDALDTEVAKGLPTGVVYPNGSGRYGLGFWRTPIKLGGSCLQNIPSSRGRGGSIVSFMPYNVTAFRIADGPPTDPSTRDSSDLMRVGNAVRGFCGEQRE
ncbi:MAG: hypothetical protein P1V34_00605 [Alphaproteobacteria bacterium]|nr:hypothetical protein [Alphaproteobacteria bacterium]